MNVSPIGREWTAHSEGCNLKAYPDNGCWSIGFGHRGVAEGIVWTDEMANTMLDADLAHACEVIREHVKVSLNQGQIDALADFIYNIGDGEFIKSTLLRVLNLSQYQQVPKEMMRWVYSDGEVSEGLKSRRSGEVALWNGENPL